jgi:putative ATPase
MNFEEKGQSPFYPGLPVPVDLFVGRKTEIQRISRAASQVATGKPQAVFIMGEYGIGKTSLAKYASVLAEEKYKLLSYHVMLGGKDSLDEMTASVVQTIIQSKISKPTVTEKIQKFLSTYIGEQSLFGISIKLDKLKKDSPDIREGFLNFLGEIYKRIQDEYNGIILVFDEINSIANQSKFAQFIKSMVDENAISNSTLPLLLILCGTDEKYRTIVEKHQPVERIFEISQIEIMNEEESHEFFLNAFNKVDMKLEEKALQILTKCSGGLPKLMHLLGEAAFWITDSTVINREVALRAVVAASEEVGRKFVDQQVYKALQSKDYHSILKKISTQRLELSFKKSDIVKKLNDIEKRKFDNFIQRMKKLNVITQRQRGEYIFRDWLTRTYIYMKSLDKH